MSAYRRVYDSRHLQADCQESESAHARYSSRLWATFTFFYLFTLCPQKPSMPFPSPLIALGFWLSRRRRCMYRTVLPSRTLQTSFRFLKTYILSTRNLQGSLNTVLFRMTYLLFQSPPTLLRSFS